FRVRPGGTLANFPSAQRVLSSGGAPVLFSGQPELALSTGRPNGSGGDGRQASHWKDDDLLGRHLGIMDPTIGRGLRFTITDNDLLAFDLFGYQVRRPSGGDTVALTSGVSQRGSISAPPAGGALVSGTHYTIQVPSGASELKIGLTGNQDVDLYVRFNQRVAPGSAGQPQADHISDSPTGTESITISPSGSPSLKVGTYYVAVANFGPGTTSFDLVATVTGRPSGNSAPSITSLNADLDGDQLILTGTVFDPDGDVTQAQSELFNSGGEKVGQTDPFPVSFGNLTTINFTVKIDNLNAIPAARLTSLIFLDRRGNRSNAMTADFGKSDPGGPTLANVSYNGSKMTIKGSSLGGQLQIEINGEVVVAGFSSAGNKVKLKGAPSSLNLLAGPNRVRVINGTLRSNLFVLNL
ncbi:MAG: pre-peptidase C-terminal domain-containing protein, partial [Blastocatellia bacterium]